MRLQFRPTIIFASLLVLSGSASAEQEDYKPAPLVIFMRSDLARTTASKRDALRKSWTEACRVMKEAFTKGKSTFGSGPFSAAHCIMRKNLLERDTAKLGSNYWILDLSRNETVLDIELAHHFKKDSTSSSQVEAQFSLELGEDTLKTLSSAQKFAPIAGLIYDKLPFAYAFKADQPSLTLNFTVPSSAAVPKYPKRLIIYGIEYSQQSDNWVPEPTGFATLTVETKNLQATADTAQSKLKQNENESADTEKVKAESTAERTESTGPVHVTVTLKPQVKNSRFKWLYAHDMRGRGFNAKELNRQLVEIRRALNPKSTDGSDKSAEDGTKEEKTLSQKILDQIAAGYVGFRFGQSVAKGEPLLENAQFLGIFTEVRSGIFNGLRYNADFGIENKIKQDDLELSFRWRRYTLGWSFGREIDFFFNRVDIIPRIGIVDIRSTLPVPSPTEAGKNTTTDFNMVDAINFGGEIGVEKNFSFAMLRLWGASDFAIGLLEKASGERGTVTSVRAGLDTYLELFRFADSIDVSLLLFGIGERISLSQSISEDEQNADKPAIEALAYSFGFLGAGLTLSW